MYQFPAFPPSHYNYIRLATHHHPHTWRRWNGGRNGGYPFLARTLRYGRVLTTQQLTRGKGRRMDERVVPSEFIVQSIRSPLVKDIHTHNIYCSSWLRRVRSQFYPIRLFPFIALGIWLQEGRNQLSAIEQDSLLNLFATCDCQNGWDVLRRYLFFSSSATHPIQYKKRFLLCNYPHPCNL